MKCKQCGQVCYVKLNLGDSNFSRKTTCACAGKVVELSYMFDKQGVVKQTVILKANWNEHGCKTQMTLSGNILDVERYSAFPIYTQLSDALNYLRSV